MCGNMVDIQSAITENRRGKEERKKEERRNHMGKIECPHLLRRAAIKMKKITVAV